MVTGGAINYGLQARNCGAARPSALHPIQRRPERQRQALARSLMSPACSMAPIALSCLPAQAQVGVPPWLLG